MIRAILTLLLLVAAPLAAARAAESPPHVTRRVTASLVTDIDNPAPGQAFRLGLRLRLAPGWHTYWKNPGDAGVPAEFTPGAGVVSASLGDIAWPAPSVVREGSLVTYAYEHDVLLTRTATRSADGGPVTAHASWLVCEKICVPEEADFGIAPGSGDAAPSAEAPLFAAADAAVPRAAPWAASLAPDGTLTVAGPGLDPAAVASAIFIPDDAAMAAPGAPPTLAVGAGGLTGKLRAGPRASGILRILDRGGATSDFALSATPGAKSPTPATGPSLGRVLLLALAGGLLLNLMPCVFPVLAMKAAGLAASADRGRVRGDALAYSAGVMLTFAALGGVLLAVRAGDPLDGWGFQFQSPPFVTAMTWLLFAIGLNLSGVFEVGGSVAGAGQSLAARGGRAGSFFTGLLAVLVATPCTAPFMGVAIAFALAAPPATALLVFLALGAGLAAPTLLLACVPRLARAMPRPGAWMLMLKQALAFPMYAAAAWLVWVVSQEAGPSGVLAAGIGLVLVGLAAWAWGLPRRRWTKAVALAACLAAIAVLVRAPTAAPAPAVAGEESFSAEKLAELRATGKTVFVNLTAAWCVTCLVNERVALSPDAVRAAFAAGHVAYLKGDWTRRDAEVTRFLRAQGRDGVPLYAVYRPGAAEPEILPQILTERIVLDAIGPAG